MGNSNKTIAFIFARGGSKGLPGKNIKEFQGKPLIAHSIEFANNHPLIDSVIVSTDCEQIAEVAKAYGAEVPFMRPQELAEDKTPEMLAWRHAVSFYKENFGDFDFFISLPAVSPLRSSDDVNMILDKVQNPAVDFVFSAVESDANPYFNLVEEHEGFYDLSKKSDIAYQRQKAKPVYQIIPMYYSCRPDRVFEFNTVLEGKNDIVVIDSNRGIDIDTIEDFEYLQYISKREHLKK